MAQKRMFDKKVIDSDNFLEMPLTTQAVYFHLNMRADDDGFVDNWKSILRLVGGKEDDLKVLISKSFVIPFEKGVIVIKHWKLNNFLRKDRYTETIYKEEKSLLISEPNGEYSLGQPTVNHLATQYSIDKNSKEENSIDKNSKEENKRTSLPAVSKKNNKDFINEFNKLWEHYPNKKGKDQALTKYILARKNGTTYEEIADGLKKYINYCVNEKLEEKYIKHGSTWFNQKCWNDVYTDKGNTKKVDNQMEILKGVHNGNFKVS